MLFSASGSTTFKIYFSLKDYLSRRIHHNRKGLFFAAGIVIFLSFIPAFKIPPLIACYALGFVFLFVIARQYPEFSFILLIFSFVFSPKLPFPGPEAHLVSLYLSDFIVAAISLAMLIRLSPQELTRLRSYLDGPIIIFLIIAAVATLKGIIAHTIDNPIIGLFYFLKRVEYFLVFYLAMYFVRDRQQERRCALSLLVCGCLVAIYGIYEHFHPFVFTPYSAYRIYERGWFQGQANHFASFLLLCICIALALLLYSRAIVEKLRYSFIATIMLPAFLWTYSRQAFLAIAIAIASLFTLKKRKYLFMAVLLLLVVVIISPFEVQCRLRSIIYAFQSDNPYYSGWAGRLYAWRMVLPDFLREPILGSGLGARHRAMYDNQYIMDLCELGLAGLVCFIWLLLRIFKLLFVSWRRQEDLFFKALSLGALAGFIGISLQALASSAFIVTRIAGPLWLLLGIIVENESFGSAAQEAS